MVKELIAKFKFWFGQDQAEHFINLEPGYFAEYEGQYVIIYKEV